MPLDAQGHEVTAQQLQTDDGTAGQSPPGESAPKDEPQFVTAEQFNTQQTQTNQLLAGLQSSMNTLAQIAGNATPASVPTAQPGPVLPTNAQLNEAIEDGRVGEVLGQYVNTSIQQAASEWEKTIIQPLRQSVEQAQNLAAESSIASASSQMPYYKQLKQQVDSVIANLAPSERTGTNIKAVYEMVVGQNIQAVIGFEADAKARQDTAIPPNAAPAPGQSVVRPNAQDDGDGIPTAESLGGQSAIAALAATGRSADEMARRMGEGYTDWDDYMKKTLNAEGGSDAK